MKRIIAMLVLGVFVPYVNAAPVTYVIEGSLTLSPASLGNDGANLDGAHFVLSFSADTNDTRVDGGSGWSEFAANVGIAVSNRPSLPDFTGPMNVPSHLNPIDLNNPDLPNSDYIIFNSGSSPDILTLNVGRTFWTGSSDFGGLARNQVCRKQFQVL